MRLPLARFRPRLLDALRGYDAARLAKDLGAGFTVAVVALLGGSPVQIAGPAGAFIVIVYGIVERHGVANLLLATAGAGVLLFLLGLLRLGGLVRRVPAPIVVGFTNGIAVLIALSQLRDWLGLSVARMPAHFFEQVGVLAERLPSFNPWALALGLATVFGLWLWPRLWHAHSALRATVDTPLVHELSNVGAKVPGPVVALVSLALAAALFQLPVETIGSRFGGIPAGLPAWSPPDFSWQGLRALGGPILTLAVLGAIESLLCARVADQVSALPPHDPNQELMAQGLANLAVSCLGGMPATGTIARTVTNVRAGATSPVAGITHAVALAAIVLLAAPLALQVPLSVLAGVLLFTAWNMGEWGAFAQLRREPWAHGVLVVLTFVLTVVFDLTVALGAGLALAWLLPRLRLRAAEPPARG